MRFCCVRAVFVPNDAAPATFEANVCVGLRKKTTLSATDQYTLSRRRKKERLDGVSHT